MSPTLRRLIGAVVLVLLWLSYSISETGNTPSDRDGRHIRNVFSSDEVCAHFADGDNWTTECVFINMGVNREKAELQFLDSQGRSQEVEIKGMGRRSTISFTLSPYGSLRLDTLGRNRSVTQGYALLDAEDYLNHRIGSTAIFRRKLPGIPTYEASAPFSSLFEYKAYFPFDHRNGFLSGVALVNVSSSYDYFERLLLEFHDEDGTLMGTSTLILPAGHHTSFSLTTQFPELVNRVGMMVISAQAPPDGFLLGGFQILGFRFNPDGPFTTISPMLSIDESFELG